MTSVMKTAPVSETTTWSGKRFEFNRICEPGAYVSNMSGHLVRFTADSFDTNHTPSIDLVAIEPQWFTKISDDPFICVSKARIAASDLDLPVRF